MDNNMVQAITAELAANERRIRECEYWSMWIAHSFWCGRRSALINGLNSARAGAETYSQEDIEKRAMNIRSSPHEHTPFHRADYEGYLDGLLWLRELAEGR